MTLEPPALPSAGGFAVLLAVVGGAGTIGPMIPISPWPGARLATPKPNRRRTYLPAQPEPEPRPSRAWLVALLLAAGCGAALLADPPCGPGCECERER